MGVGNQEIEYIRMLIVEVAKSFNAQSLKMTDAKLKVGAEATGQQNRVRVFCHSVNNDTIRRSIDWVVKHYIDDHFLNAVKYITLSNLFQDGFDVESEESGGVENMGDAKRSNTEIDPINFTPSWSSMTLQSGISKKFSDMMFKGGTPPPLQGLNDVNNGGNMTTKEFAYWLQGFFEISNPDMLDSRQTQIIKDHLDLVFDKKTPSNEVPYVTNQQFSVEWNEVNPSC